MAGEKCATEPEIINRTDVTMGKMIVLLPVITREVMLLMGNKISCRAWHY